MANKQIEESETPKLTCGIIMPIAASQGYRTLEKCSEYN